MKDKNHIHEFKYYGSGTDLITGVSDISYACECGLCLRQYLPKEVYLQRKYPKTIVCELFNPTNK